MPKALPAVVAEPPEVSQGRQMSNATQHGQRQESLASPESNAQSRFMAG